MLSNLASISLALGAPADAIPLYERSIAIFDAAGLGDKYEGITALGNLAGALPMVGRHDEAEVRLRDLIARAERTLGPDASIITSALFNLGNSRLLQGDPARADAPCTCNAPPGTRRYAAGRRAAGCRACTAGAAR